MLPSRSASQAHFKSHDRIRSFELHSQNVHSVSWNADGKRLASGSLDKNVIVSSLSNSRLKQEFTCRGHDDQVDQVSWHPVDTELLASASGDKTVRVWDVRKRTGVATLNSKGKMDAPVKYNRHGQYNSGQNINVGWCPGKPYLAVGDKDDKISIADTRMWKIVHVETFKTETNEFAWDPTGQYLFVTTGNGQIPVFKFPEMTKVVTLQANPLQSLCLSIKMDPANKHFAVGGGDALVCVWDLRNLVCLRTIDRLDWPVRAVGFSWDGQLLASGSEDHSIDIAWVETGERVWDLKCDGSSFSMAWHPREYLLAFSCEDRSNNDQYSRSREVGNVKLFGLSPDQI